MDMKASEESKIVQNTCKREVYLEMQYFFPFLCKVGLYWHKHYTSKTSHWSIILLFDM
jgi:hypothetical protein